MYIALGKQSYPFGDKCYNYIFNTIGKNNWIFIFLQTYRNNRSSIVLIPALGYFFVSEKSITCIFIIIIYPWCEMIEIIIKLITKHFPHSTLLPPSHFGKNLCQLQTDRQDRQGDSISKSSYELAKTQKHFTNSNLLEGYGSRQ